MANIIVTPNLSGPPILSVNWEGYDIFRYVWALAGEIIADTTAPYFVPSKSGTYSAIVTASDDTVTATDEVYVDTGYVPNALELIIYSPAMGDVGVSRYTTIEFDIVETHGRALPLSYVNFFVYQNGALIEAISKNSAYVAYSQLPNGWHFVINGGSAKFKFKCNSNIEVSIETVV